MTTTDLHEGGAPTVDAAAINYADYFTQDAARKKLAEQLRPDNKAALFDALARAGVASVLVTFDGSGDEGQIEDMAVHDAAGAPLGLPEASFTFATPLFEGTGVETQTLSVKDAIESFVYDLLEQSHGGWEINEGAYGEFTFDVRDRSIRLDYNERVESSVYSGHEW